MARSSRRAASHLSPLLVLDACCLINLGATGRLGEILGALEHRCTTARYVAESEVLSIAGSAGSDGIESIDLGILVSDRRLELLDLETDGERSLFVDFAATLDDGEAHCCALAVARDGALATDDRKTRNGLARLHPGMKLLGTAELIAHWAGTSGLPAAEIQHALRSIMARGRFRPARNDPRFDWWMKLVGNE